MPLVIIEEDRKYRREGDRYVQISGPTEKPTSNRWTLAWDPTTLRPSMPDQCPHCDGPVARERSISLILPTRYRGGARASGSRITIPFGTCRKVPPPFLSYLGLITSIFFAVVFGLAALAGNLVGVALFAIALVGIAWSWRAYGWLRFARFDHRSIRLRARRRSYANAIAAANGGRVS